MTKPVPYLNIRYYEIKQVAALLGWSTHNVSQRARLAKLERVTDGVYTAESVDRYLLARHLTARARKDGYKSPHLLWPDATGTAAWNGHIYQQE